MSVADVMCRAPANRGKIILKNSQWKAIVDLSRVCLALV